MRTVFVAVAAAVLAASGAFAETGGAQYVEITGAAGALVLRDGPTPGASIVSRLDEGTLLRTIGCRMAAGRKWCEVELPTDTSVKGWVGMTNLRIVPALTPAN